MLGVFLLQNLLMGVFRDAVLSLVFIKMSCSRIHLGGMSWLNVIRISGVTVTSRKSSDPKFDLCCISSLATIVIVHTVVPFILLQEAS